MLGIGVYEVEVEIVGCCGVSVVWERGAGGGRCRGGLGLKVCKSVCERKRGFGLEFEVEGGLGGMVLLWLYLFGGESGEG